MQLKKLPRYSMTHLKTTSSINQKNARRFSWWAYRSLSDLPSLDQIFHRSASPKCKSRNGSVDRYIIINDQYIGLDVLCVSIFHPFDYVLFLGSQVTTKKWDSIFFDYDFELHSTQRIYYYILVFLTYLSVCPILREAKWLMRKTIDFKVVLLQRKMIEAGFRDYRFHSSIDVTKYSNLRLPLSRIEGTSRWTHS